MKQYQEKYGAITGASFSTIRTDTGTQFTSKEFKQYCQILVPRIVGKPKSTHAWNTWWLKFPNEHESRRRGVDIYLLTRNGRRNPTVIYLNPPNLWWIYSIGIWPELEIVFDEKFNNCPDKLFDSIHLYRAQSLWETNDFTIWVFTRVL